MIFVETGRHFYEQHRRDSTDTIKAPIVHCRPASRNI